MASLSYLQPYLDEVHEKAVEWDVRSPLIDALQDQLIGRPFELCKRTQCLCIMPPPLPLPARGFPPIRPAPD